jgi:hypothetical protein
VRNSSLHRNDVRTTSKMADITIMRLPFNLYNLVALSLEL